jgi:hypothetical protein
MIAYCSQPNTYCLLVRNHVLTLYYLCDITSNQVHASQAEVAALREQLREREVQQSLLTRTAGAEQRYASVYTTDYCSVKVMAPSLSLYNTYRSFMYSLY